MNITYKEIGEFCNKKEPTIKSMSKNNPQQLELLKIGAMCKKYNISINEIKLIYELKKDLIHEQETKSLAEKL